MGLFNYIEDLSNRIGKRIGTGDSDDYVEAYQYFVFFLISHTITFGFGLILSFIFRYTVQYIICTLTFMILRRSAGGYHCDTFKKCFFTTNLIMLSSVTISCITLHFPVSIMIFSILFGTIVIENVPRATENSPSRGHLIDMKFKKKYIITLIVYLIIMIVSLFLKQYIICTSVASGITVVSFMVSDCGDKLLNRI